MTQEKLQEDNTPIQLLGEFLQLICSFHDLQPFLLKQRSGQRRNTCNIVSHLATTPFSHTTLGINVCIYMYMCMSVCLSVCWSLYVSVCSSCYLCSILLFLSLSISLSLSVSPPSGSPQGTYQLHYAPGYTQSQLLRLITEIYEGVPESFEVFYCHPSTNEEELKIFMERVKHHSLLYLILEVNKLPQEVHVQYLLICPFIHPDPSHSYTYSSIHYTQSIHPSIYFLHSSIL